MKALYKKPEIKVDELMKRDVLCDSPVSIQNTDNLSRQLLNLVWIFSDDE